MNSALIIDVQGFKTENKKFLPKELAIFDGVRLNHYVFKPPFQFRCLPVSLQREANWLMKNHHCIDWNEGYTPLFQFRNIVKNISNRGTVVYVKGKEKADFIRKFSSVPVIELDEQPAFRVLEAKCFYHSKSPCICAVSNVHHVYENFIMN